jgi:hypothetical protein
MDKKQKLQMLGSFALLLVAAGVLFWAFTRTEEERLDLSKATLRGRVTYKGQPVSNVPKKLFNPETSGITAVLSNTEGENVFDISLN